MQTNLIQAVVRDAEQKVSSRNIFVFTKFLQQSQIEEITTLTKQVPVQFNGGCHFSTRKIARFGSTESCFGSGDYPIVILYVCPTGKKFAKQVSHRDFLGSVLSVGIERNTVGDIFVNDNEGYIVCLESVCEHIKVNLKKVGGNSVQVCEVNSVPEIFMPQKRQVQLTVSSVRLDSIISKLFNLSRQTATEIIEKQMVFIGGKPCQNASCKLIEGQTISVRGHGKFDYISSEGVSRKGKIYVCVMVY